MELDLDTELKVNHLFLEQRECRTCGEVKNLLTDFYLSRKDSTKKSSYAYECKDCTKVRVTKNHDPVKKRNLDLKRLYGIDLEDYNRLLTEQKNCCAVCGTDKPGGKHSSFNVDHCHTTGKVRGLLCKSCNIMIGEAKDNVDILKNAMLYLNEHNK